MVIILILIDFVQFTILKNVEIQIDIIYINDKKFYEPYAINFHTGAMDYGD